MRTLAYYGVCLLWAFLKAAATMLVWAVVGVCVVLAWVGYALVPHNEERRGRR